MELSSVAWHHLQVDDVLEMLQTDKENGLSSEEAEKRLKQFGVNELPEQDRRSPLIRFLFQFHNMLIYVLLAAAGITALMDHWIDTWVILGVVLINALIGFIQEGKAEEALENLKKMLSLKALVIRDGKRQEIDAKMVVPGDIIQLESGDKIPADVRIIYERNLKAEESALTGESQPVQKSIESVAKDSLIGDRFSLGYKSTMITYGRATAVVIGTGANTEIGKINTMMSEVEKLTTPLIRQIDEFGKTLSIMIIALVAIMFAVGYFFHDYELSELFLALIGLAVAAIPEGLPAIMTITMALGVQRMASKNAIIRKLPSVETLGSVTVICSDKTGTLTKNEMTVRTVITSDKSYKVEGTGYAPQGDILFQNNKVSVDEFKSLKKLIQTVQLCNNAHVEKDGEFWNLKGDPTEGALITLGLKSEVKTDDFKRLDIIPFESENKFMATLHTSIYDERFIFLKGAPERLLEMCSGQLSGSGSESLNHDYWREQIESIASKGERVMAAAFKQVDNSVNEIDMKDINTDMIFLGLIGMIDPPRPEAIEAIKTCKEAGIKVKMITGDHVSTAKAIGEQLGICDGREAITGIELEKATDDELITISQKYDIFARTSPEHKLRLVTALQAQGEIVAMTGDGINDAPALKRSNVGVAMGIKGTEVTKEASEMVLTDDNFVSIAAAVEEGRTIYDNLRKTILFILPTNGAEAFVILTAITIGIALPITPAQILWVNMVTAVTLALALSFEPTEIGVMKRPPRNSKIPIIGSYFVWRIIFVSLLIGGFTLLLYSYLKSEGYVIEEARTIAVNVLVAGQVFYLYNCRYLRDSFFKKGFFANKVAQIAVAVLIVIQLVFVYAPFMNVWFGTMPIKTIYWGWVIASGFLVFLLVELEKWGFNVYDRRKLSQNG